MYQKIIYESDETFIIEVSPDFLLKKVGDIINYFGSDYPILNNFSYPLFSHYILSKNPLYQDNEQQIAFCIAKNKARKFAQRFQKYI